VASVTLAVTDLESEQTLSSATLVVMGLVRLQVARACAVAGVGVCLLGTLLPWLRSGERERSSYQLAGLAGRLLDGPTDAVAHVWLTFPLLATGAIAVLLWHPGRAVFVACALVAVVGAAFAVLVARAPLPGLIGLWVTWLGAAATVAALFLVPRTVAPPGVD
jgi:hypothetical protein